MSKMLKTLAIVTAVTVGGAVVAHESFAADQNERVYGRGNGNCSQFMGKGHRGMGAGRGPMMGMLGHFDPDRVLSAAQIKTLAEAHLIRMGNPNLKVGKITKTENGNYAVETVTKDGSLVDTIIVNKASGMPEHMVERMRERFEDRDDNYGRRGMGQGYRQGGPGMGGRGMGGRGVGVPGMGGARFAKDIDLSKDDVRVLSEAQLIKSGNHNLKVGSVKEISDDIYTVQIVTKDGSLVNTIQVNEKTGRPYCGPARMVGKR